MIYQLLLEKLYHNGKNLQKLCEFGINMKIDNLPNNMKQVTFYFLDKLNDFLPLSQRGKSIPISFQGRQSIKHLIEALHVPHTEVGEMLVNGSSVDFSYLVNDGDHVQVIPITKGYPGADSIDDKESDGAPRFVLDNHLGKLARYLRMLGFDALYSNNYQDDELAQISEQDGRFLVTRDRGLLMRKTIARGYCVRSKEPKQQFVELVERFDLFDRIRPFQRCLRCNGQLQPVAKADILDRLEPLTIKYYNEFQICPECCQIYWKGSHYKRMESFMLQMKDHK